MKTFIPNRIRYARQPDGYSCSAMALLNLDKWRGLHVTLKDLPRYKKLCKSCPVLGTARAAFRKVVGRTGRRFTYEQIKKHPGVFLLETRWPEGGCHHYLVLGWATDGTHFGWLCVNYWAGYTYTLISPPTMRRNLKHSIGWLFYT